VSAPAYDRIGLSYSEVRRSDPRLQAAICKALGDAKNILNIGAGARTHCRSRGTTASSPSSRRRLRVLPVG